MAALDGVELHVASLLEGGFAVVATKEKAHRNAKSQFDTNEILHKNKEPVTGGERV